MCEFRNEYTVFSELNCEVFGVSADSERSHLSFSEKYHLPYRLLVDRNKDLRRSWNVPNSFFVLDGRVTYIIDADGICQLRYSNSTSAKKHVTVALQRLHELPVAYVKRGNEG